MRSLRKVFRLMLLFTGCYYLLYLILFNVEDDAGRPIVTRLQEYTVLHKDIFSKSLEDIDHSTTYDLVFLGSSHAYRGFDVKYFEEQGYTAFNLGSSSQTPLNSYALLQKINAKNIVMEVYPVAFGLSGFETFLSMNASIKDYGVLLKSAWYLKNMRAFSMLSLKPFIDYRNRNVTPPDSNYYKGYVMTRDSAGTGITYKDETLDLNNAAIQISYLKKIISYCQDKSIGLVLVVAPVPSRLKINGMEEVLSEIKFIAQSRNVRFLDYSRDHKLDDATHFFDDDHLNHSGVRYFNERLLKDLSL